METEYRNAVVYARYSSHRQGEQSIEGQLAAAQKYARDNNLRIIHEYIDRAMTGRNDNREQFQQMLKDTSKKQFSVIIVWKIDRFGRNREEIAFNKHKCKKNGVKVVYVAENVPDSPEGVILESVLEGMAEYYSLQLSQNIKRGNRASAEKCQSTGGNRPLGYKTDPETKRFVIDEDTAPTVRKIFDMYAKGATCTEIINHLNEQGLRTLRGGKFTKNSLRTVLKNEKYIGIYSYKNDIRIEGGVPAIIDPEVFAKVQEMLKINKRAPAHTWSRAEYLLTDKLYCGHCGSKMVGESGTSHTGAKHNYYICTKRKREHACDKKAVRQEWIEDVVINATMDLLNNEELFQFIIDAVWEYYQAEKQDTAYLLELKSKLKDTETAQANLLKAIEAGIFNEATKRRMEELEIQREELNYAIAGAELSKDLGITRDYIEFYLTDFRNGETDNPAFQKRLVDTFINAVFVYDDKVTITFNYSGDNRTVTLAEIDSAENSGEVRMSSVKFHQKSKKCPKAVRDKKVMVLRKKCCNIMLQYFFIFKRAK